LRGGDGQRGRRKTRSKCPRREGSPRSVRRARQATNCWTLDQHAPPTALLRQSTDRPSRQVRWQRRLFLLLVEIRTYVCTHALCAVRSLFAGLGVASESAPKHLFRFSRPDGQPMNPTAVGQRQRLHQHAQAPTLNRPSGSTELGAGGRWRPNPRPRALPEAGNNTGLARAEASRLSPVASRRGPSRSWLATAVGWGLHGGGLWARWDGFDRGHVTDLVPCGCCSIHRFAP
jgi:hypothetical protein